MKEAVSDLGEDARSLFEAEQKRICSALSTLDGGVEFRFDTWRRAGGGGGLTAILSEGTLFEKAGVNTSAVWGELDERALERLGGSERTFYATGLSLVLHPRNPMVPTLHANFRYLRRGERAWFGGGSDLTPYYPYREDVIDFHHAWKTICDRHSPHYYRRFKKWCDEYFYIPHRAEMRGVGGIFFDDLSADAVTTLPFLADCCRHVLEPYVLIAQRRRGEPYGEQERRFQSFRRGRYVEFNLLYDRGTTFGLATNGRVESILMSLPPLAGWWYAYEPEANSREARAMRFFQPQEWL